MQERDKTLSRPGWGSPALSRVFLRRARCRRAGGPAMMARQERVVNDPNHEDVRDAIRKIRDEGFGAIVEPDGARMITAATREDQRPKREGLKIVTEWRFHERREGMLRSWYPIDTLEVYQYLQQGFELIEEPVIGVNGD